MSYTAVNTLAHLHHCSQLQHNGPHTWHACRQQHTLRHDHISPSTMHTEGMQHKLHTPAPYRPEHNPHCMADLLKPSEFHSCPDCENWHAMMIPQNTRKNKTSILTSK